MDPRRVPLTVDDLRALERQLRTVWGIRPQQLRSASPSVAIVNGGDVMLVVRRTSEQIAKAMAASLELYGGDSWLSTRVPRAVPTRSGQQFMQFQGNAAILLTYLHGAVPTSVTPQLAHDVGELLARLHLSAGRRSWDAEDLPTGRALFTPACAEAIEAAADSSMAGPRLRRAMVLALERLGSVAAFNRLPKVPAHGDICLENLLVESGVVKLIDFGGVFGAPRIVDLQNAVANLAGRDRVINQEVHQALMDRYHQLAPLTLDERRLLPDVMILDLARIVAWLMEQLKTRPHSGLRWELDYRVALLERKVEVW